MLYFKELSDSSDSSNHVKVYIISNMKFKPYRHHFTECCSTYKQLIFAKLDLLLEIQLLNSKLHITNVLLMFY